MDFKKLESAKNSRLASLNINLNKKSRQNSHYSNVSKDRLNSGGLNPFISGRISPLSSPGANTKSHLKINNILLSQPTEKKTLLSKKNLFSISNLPQVASNNNKEPQKILETGGASDYVQEQKVSGHSNTIDIEKRWN